MCRSKHSPGPRSGGAGKCVAAHWKSPSALLNISLSYKVCMQDTGDKEHRKDGHTAVLCTVVPNPVPLGSLSTVEESHPPPA